jgi:hypothetical protein
MRRHLTWRLTLALLAPLSVACGNSGSATSMGAGGTAESATSGHSSTASTAAGSTTGSGGGMMAGLIPDPGTVDQVDNNFGSVEPNNTPEQATPLGTASSGSVNVWVDTNTVGGSDNPADYFVFKSGSAAGQFTLDICFTAPLTGLTATLWKVAGGEAEMPPVGTWTSSGTCVTDHTTPAALEASTDYLFGITATGGVGTYSA